MEHRKQVTNEVERRAFDSDFVVRDLSSKDGERFAIRGYAARFGSVYDMGWFTEEVSRDAFKGADMSDVRILFNHDPNQILGRTKSGTATVGVDEKGLWYEVELPQSASALREAVERGDVDQSSWGFFLKKDKWEKREGSEKQHRVLEEVEMVFDASPVTFPANPDTSVAKRSFEAYAKPAEPEENAEQRNEEEQINTELQVSIALLERQLDYLNSTI